MTGAYVYFSIVDAKGDISRVRIDWGGTNDLVDFGLNVADIAVVGPLIHALTDGGLLNVGVCYEYDTSGLGWTATAAANSDVQEKAEFAFRTAGGFLSRMNVPCFKEAKFNAGTREVNQADSDVSAFTTYMISGNATNPDPTDKRADDLISLAYATENWGRRRR